jgi:hypothetical protein
LEPCWLSRRELLNSEGRSLALELGRTRAEDLRGTRLGSMRIENAQRRHGRKMDGRFMRA